jgi:hypothetical protein
MYKLSQNQELVMLAQVIFIQYINGALKGVLLNA